MLSTQTYVRIDYLLVFLTIIICKKHALRHRQNFKSAHIYRCEDMVFLECSHVYVCVYCFSNINNNNTSELHSIGISKKQNECI